MNIFRSIRWRLQLWYGLLFAVLLAGLGVTAYFVVRNNRLERIDDELQRFAFLLSRAARNQPPGPRDDRGRRPGVDHVALTSVLSAEDQASGLYYALWRRNGPAFVASEHAPADLPQPTATESGLRSRGEFREAFINSNPGDYSLIGRSIAADIAGLHRFGWLLAGGGLAVFAITVAIGWLLISRALLPVRAISEAATKIATGDLAQRINTQDTDSELGQLAGVLNSTFARLESAFAQQGRFTADAAHELRTPVSVILTHTQNALATDGLSEEQREALEACQRASQRMRQIIESLLQLARLDAGEARLQQETVDLADLVRECIELVAPSARERKITVRLELEPAVARGDRGRLAQVVTNLLSNAVHHNREGGEMCVWTRRGNDSVILVVADNGPGIARQHLPRVFDRFYRADEVRTSTTGRTGLGLAISRAIVEAHGGSIEAASEPGKGAVFTVRLPA